jgi:hypothetical protein
LTTGPPERFVASSKDFLAIVLERAIRLIKNQPTRVGLFVLAALVLAAIHTNKGECNVAWISTEERQIRDVILQLRRLRPEVPTGSRILLLRDPFEGRVWDSIFLLRLFYRDNSLVVELGPDGHDVEGYDYVWDFEQGKLREVGGVKSKRSNEARRTPGHAAGGRRPGAGEQPAEEECRSLFTANLLNPGEYTLPGDAHIPVAAN